MSLTHKSALVNDVFGGGYFFNLQGVRDTHPFARTTFHIVQDFPLVTVTVFFFDPLLIQSLLEEEHIFYGLPLPQKICLLIFCTGLGGRPLNFLGTARSSGSSVRYQGL